jgi:hypothetical protein
MNGVMYDQGRLSNIIDPGQNSALGSLPTQSLTGITKVNGDKIKHIFIYRDFQQNQCLNIKKTCRIQNT